MCWPRVFKAPPLLTPCAYAEKGNAEIIAYCHSQMSDFKTPKAMVLGPISENLNLQDPKNSCCAIRRIRRAIRPERPWRQHFKARN
jgi:hypothetical protein